VQAYNVEIPSLRIDAEIDDPIETQAG